MRISNCLRMAFTIASLLALAAPAFAQANYSPGDVIEVRWRGKPTRARVQQCNGDSCSVYIWEEALGRFAEGTLIFWARDIIRPLSRAGGNAEKGRNDAGPAQPRPQPRANPAQAGGCDSDPGIATPPKANSPLATIFKHAILENYEAEINDSTTAPLKVGVTFDAFEIGPATVNRANRYGVEYPSAAVGATIYPVKTKHTLCRLYKGGPTRTLFDGRYACFKNRQGEWVCPAAPGHKILGYQ